MKKNNLFKIVLDKDIKVNENYSIKKDTIIYVPYSKVINEIKLIYYDGWNYLKESSLSKIQRHIEDGFFIITAFKYYYSKEENLKRNEILQNKLRSFGLGYITLIGGYIEIDKKTGEEKKVTELSLFVPYKNKIQYTENKFKKIAIECMTINNDIQEAILYSLPKDKNIYSLYSNSKIDIIGEFHIYKMGDYWSQLKKGSKNKKIKFVFEGYKALGSQVATMLAEKLGEII